jgi:hypothetical protein
MVLCPPFPNKEQDTGPIILVIIILQKIRYTAKETRCFHFDLVDNRYIYSYLLTGT